MPDSTEDQREAVIDCDRCSTGIMDTPADPILISSGDATICRRCYVREMTKMGETRPDGEEVRDALRFVTGLGPDAESRMVLGEVADLLHWGVVNYDPATANAILARAYYVIRYAIDRQIFAPTTEETDER